MLKLCVLKKNIPTLLFIRCVSLDKVCNLLESWFPYMQNGYNNHLLPRPVRNNMRLKTGSGTKLAFNQSL